jgi:hypothetical protein
MKIKDFKTHTISRSTPPHFSSYGDYKPYLEKDFGERCAYCNLHSKRITTPFEVDHFIPRKAFKGVRPSLDTDYNNLVYACKKCNVAKSGKFEGDLTEVSPTNTLFYDPVLVDYNSIFYRNELGAIDSDDPKGKSMIKMLKLYRPIHILAWLCDEIRITRDKLQRAIDTETNESKKQEYQKALDGLNAQYCKFVDLFIASYNDNNFELVRQDG